jgi:precorrin-6B methylase 2
MDQNVIVTVSGDIEAVAERLRAAGMQVGQVLAEIGIITGSVDDERRAALADVAGVVAVEAEREVRISPPQAEPPSQDSAQR